MARIRTLKPEFFNSPSTAQADLAVRLTFQAMWSWADDSGHGTANLKELEAFAWPNDNIADLPRMTRGNSGDKPGRWRSFAEVCGEVAEAYGVVFYRVRHRPYYWIPNFKQHQSKDYRPESRYPLIEEGEIFDVTSGETIPASANGDVEPDDPATTPGSSGDPSGDAALGTGEQGNRGIGEQSLLATPNGATGRTSVDDQFAQWWDIWPKKVKKAGARKVFPAAIKKIPLPQLIEKTAAWAKAYEATGNARKFIPDPERWLKNEQWDDDLGGPKPFNIDDWKG